MGLLKRWHPPTIHDKNLKAPEKRELLKKDELSQVEKDAKREYEEGRLKKAREDEKKKFLEVLKRKDSEREAVVKRIELEQKSITKFKESMEKELKKTKGKNWTIEGIKKVLERFGFVFDPDSRWFKLKGKKFNWQGLKDSFQPWQAAFGKNAGKSILLHPLGFLVDLAAIVLHKPGFVRLQQERKKFEKNLAAREKILEEMQAKLKTADAK